MKHTRKVMLGGTAIAMAAALVAATRLQTVQAPKFEVEMLWPKPMPNHWLLGSTTGLAIDSRDHVFVINLPNSFTARTELGAEANPPISECCLPSPNVLEYDPAGNLVGHWGGPGTGYEWPVTNTGLAIDTKGNIWIGGTGPSDAHILKFARDGKFVATVGKFTPASFAVPLPAAVDTAYAGVGGRGRAGGDSAAGRAGRGGGGRGRGGRGGPAPSVPPNSMSTESFGGPAGISFDASGEAYIADGSRNHRVAVVDVATGSITRYWGAYGSQPSDAPQPAYNPNAPPSKQFAYVACAEASKDGMVYVCDRQNDRIQVFKKDGSFVKEKVIAPKTLGEGSVWDVTFSRDAQQKYLYVADGLNMKIWVLDRQSLEILTSFGDGGRQPGQFFGVHSIATDSKGNLYTVETYQGKRVQKFTFRGVGAVPAKPKMVLWPGGGR